MKKTNFSSPYYKNIALNKHNATYETEKTAKDAFMLCIKDLPYEDLDNLCALIQQYYQNRSTPITFTIEECYNLTQNQTVNTDFKRVLLELAYECVHSGKTLGSKKVEGKDFTTSSWISHALLHAEASAHLAKEAGLEPDTAKKLGILHDIGRKFTHKFLHTIAGYEYLVDEGWYNEAVACLTHSFLGVSDKGKIKGIRCANCEQATKGFYVDENGNPCWEDTTEKDDITLFLEGYNYNEYDSIINIADLIATSSCITTPYDRVTDIAKRKPIDPTNRNFFKASFCNTMLRYLEEVDEVHIAPNIKATPSISDEAMDKAFYDVSNIFANFYNKNAKTKIESTGKVYKKTSE